MPLNWSTRSSWCPRRLKLRCLKSSWRDARGCIVLLSWSGDYPPITKIKNSYKSSLSTPNKVSWATLPPFSRKRANRKNSLKECPSTFSRNSSIVLVALNRFTLTLLIKQDFPALSFKTPLRPKVTSQRTLQVDIFKTKVRSRSTCRAQKSFSN